MDQSVTVHLPRDLNLSALARVRLVWPDNATLITLRLHPDQWVRPAGLAGLACLIARSQSQGTAFIVEHAHCQSVGYWQRMGFFEVLSLDGPAAAGFHQPADGQFCELRRISDIYAVDEVTEALVAVTDPTPEGWKVYSHIVSEALNNVCQHRQFRRFLPGAVQSAGGQGPTSNHPYGCGLRHALRAFRPDDDRAAIAKALEVGVTSGQTRMGTTGMRNRGVGLSAIHKLVAGNGGDLVIWSGNGVFPTNKSLCRGDVPAWQGTLLAARMERNNFSRGFRDVMLELDAELRERERERPARLPRRSSGFSRGRGEFGMEWRTLTLKRDHRFLGGRGVAHQVRTAAEALLRKDPPAVVVLDFAGVDGVSHSFADELLSPLSDLLHEAVRSRVLLANCSGDVREELELVAAMHGLFMPGALAAARRAAGPN